MVFFVFNKKVYHLFSSNYGESWWLNWHNNLFYRQFAPRISKPSPVSPTPKCPVQEMSQNETEELGGEEPDFQWGSGRLRGWIAWIRFFIKHMGISENSGTPKSSNLIGISIINHPCWGTTIFGNTQLVYSWYLLCSNIFFWFSPRILGEMIQFDLRIFFRWVETTN